MRHKYFYVNSCILLHSLVIVLFKFLCFHCDGGLDKRFTNISTQTQSIVALNLFFNRQKVPGASISPRYQSSTAPQRTIQTKNSSVQPTETPQQNCQSKKKTNFLFSFMRHLLAMKIII
jgi:hypothetical protein